MDQFNNLASETNNNNAAAATQRLQMEEITSRLDQMNVELAANHDDDDETMDTEQDTQNCAGQHRQATYPLATSNPEETNYYSALMERDESIAIEQLNRKQNRQRNQQPSDILIVTNVDSSIFHEQQMKLNFEALFLNYDPNVTFRYLKSFRRVRLDFSDWQRAEAARQNLAHFRLGQSEFKCYAAQIIRPTKNNKHHQMENHQQFDEGQEEEENSIYLNIPKLTKQFLISPPASPPVGWEPVAEQSPCIDVQLLSAIVNLVPGKVHEIHAGSDSQPGIFVEVCEEPTFERLSMKSCSRIPRTMSPAGFCQPMAPFAPSAGSNRGG